MKKALCSYRSPWGQCQQPRPEGGRHCLFHREMLRIGNVPDAYYHEKVCRGLLTPAVVLLKDDETRAMMTGRAHGDGRRLDAYCMDDPLEAA